MDMFSEGKSGSERKPFPRFHSILTHLQFIAETTGRLEETLRKQINDGVLFSDKAISQTNHLFYQQTEILRSLADVIRNGGEGIRRRAIEECKNRMRAWNVYFLTSS
jgi:Na+/phosphate symporter